VFFAEVVWVGEEGDSEWRGILGVVRAMEWQREGGDGGLEEGAVASTWERRDFCVFGFVWIFLSVFKILIILLK
jgi:hypothetical protein